MGVAEYDLALRGKASGGNLALVQILTKEVNYAVIDTSPGESASSVASRMQSAVHRSGVPMGLWEVQGGTMFLPLGGAGHVFAGTETGLGIPRPPTSLSCGYDSRRNRIVLNWVSDPRGYDAVGVAEVYPESISPATQPGRDVFKGTTYAISVRGMVCVNDALFYIVGWRGGGATPKDTIPSWRDGTPSNAAAMHLSYNSQDELFGIPFTAGTAPNWKRWATHPSPADVCFEQGTVKPQMRYGQPYPYIDKPTDKRFYQVVKTKKPEGKAGIWRKFLGLTPGHKYRVTVLLNTLEMDKAKGQWSFSFHAARNAPDGKDFTPEQMTGEAALPDGSKGEKAGRMVCYGPGQTTKGEWAYCSTSPDDRSPGRETGDITLPEKVDTITVWLRHQAEDSKGVGYLWIKLEDLSMPPPLPAENPAK